MMAEGKFAVVFLAVFVILTIMLIAAFRMNEGEMARMLWSALIFVVLIFGVICISMYLRRGRSSNGKIS